MTPLPKRKLSTRRQGDRRSHFKLALIGLILCPNCKRPYFPHRMCKNCGYYKGRLVKQPKQKRQEKAQ